MEPEYMRILDKYAGRHARLIFWLFIILGAIALITPVLINLMNIWVNVEWVFNRMGITSLLGRIITAIIGTTLAFIGLRLLTIIIAFGIRLAYATPIHWRIETTLNQTITLLHELSEAEKTQEQLKVKEVLAEAEAILTTWNSSCITRLVRWIVITGRRKK